MLTEKQNNSDENSPKKGEINKRGKTLRHFVYTSYFLSLILLVSVMLAIVANRKAQPFYSWIEGSRVEKYGHFVAGLIIEQKVSMQVDAQNDPLTETEVKEFDERIESLTNRTKQRLNLSNLEPRDKRFILSHSNLVPFLQGDYLIMANENTDEISKFGAELDRLFVNFIQEMQDCDLGPEMDSRPHICFFKSRGEYLQVTKKDGKYFHDSLGYFSPIKNCIYFFSRKGSLEGLEMAEKYEKHRQQCREKYEGAELFHYLTQLDFQEEKYEEKLDDETLCTLRHEGAHQLSHMYGLHSTRGFEKRWLTEGIAQYFETYNPGEVRVQKKTLLNKCLMEGKLFTWDMLVNQDEGVFIETTHENRQIAYSQCWHLVRHMMKNYKSGFFEFIKMKKNSGILDSPIKDFDQLCKLLKVNKEQFIKELDEGILEL